MDLFGKSPRPTWNTEMRMELAKVFGQQLYDWTNKDTPLEKCIADCEEIFLYHSGNDGYDLAKEFDYRGYNPDAQLVEILEDVWGTKMSMLREAVKQWVKEDDIQPPYEVGTNMLWKYGHKMVEGVITGTHPETAQYQVAIPSEGMTVEGGRKAVLNYEDATPINQPT